MRNQIFICIFWVFLLIGCENPLEILPKEGRDTYTFTYCAPQINFAPTISKNIPVLVLMIALSFLY